MAYTWSGAKLMKCLVLLRAGPILSVSDSLLCLHCFDLAKTAQEGL